MIQYLITSCNVIDTYGAVYVVAAGLLDVGCFSSILWQALQFVRVEGTHMCGNRGMRNFWWDCTWLLFHCEMHLRHAFPWCLAAFLPLALFFVPYLVVLVAGDRWKMVQHGARDGGCQLALPCVCVSSVSCICCSVHSGLQHFETMAKLRAGSLFVVVFLLRSGLWMLFGYCTASMRLWTCALRFQGGVSLSTICHSVLVAVLLWWCIHLRCFEFGVLWCSCL